MVPLLLNFLEESMRDALENIAAGMLMFGLSLLLALWFAVCIPIAAPFWIYDALRVKKGDRKVC